MKARAVRPADHDKTDHGRFSMKDRISAQAMRPGFPSDIGNAFPSRQ